MAFHKSSETRSTGGDDVTALSRLLRLPEEILLHIFGFLYQPWYLEVEIRKNLLLEYYYEEPRIYALPFPPDRALLSTCSLTRRISRDAILDAFIGVMNSQEDHWMGTLEDLQFPVTWTQIEPRIKKLCLPSTKFSLVNSKEFILKLAAVEGVELFENFNITVVADLAVGSAENVMAIPNEYFEQRAKRILPSIPEDIPFSCNGGNVDLLLHVHFDFWRHIAFSPPLNVLFRIGPNSLPEVIKKEWGPRIMPMSSVRFNPPLV